MKHPKRKKRSSASKSKDSDNQGSSCKVADGEKQKILTTLMEAFASASLEEVASAYKEACGDPDTAAEILANVTERAVQEDQSTFTTCSSSSGNLFWGSSSRSSSNCSDVYGDSSDFQGDGYKQMSKPKSKKVIASAGIVSTMLGKEYVRSTPKKVSLKSKGFNEQNWRNGEAEQFLCSMLGEESELG